MAKEGCSNRGGCEIYSSADFGSEPYLIKIGDNVRVNACVKFVTHDGGVWVLRHGTEAIKSDLSNADLFGTIEIGNNVHIGTGTIIMPGVTIGSNCIIGCGAIVTKNIPDNSIAVGVPARVIETVEEYFEKHKADFDYTKSMSAAEKHEYLCCKYKDYMNT
ncbi:MAG: acyltransferase [Eubacteriales bacterium]|nr:acyltransferase [Eubacteriales bacterium]